MVYSLSSRDAKMHLLRGQVKYLKRTGKLEELSRGRNATDVFAKVARVSSTSTLEERKRKPI